MTATHRNVCVGWLGPCELYGAMHGCRLPEGGHRWHECRCGARIRAWSTRSRGETAEHPERRSGL